MLSMALVNCSVRPASADALLAAVRPITASVVMAAVAATAVMRGRDMPMAFMGVPLVARRWLDDQSLFRTSTYALS